MTVHRHKRRAVTALALAMLTLMAASVQAGPLKSAMERMAHTTKAAKAALGSHDPAEADAVMQAYAEEARAAADLLPAGGAKAKDLRDRFATLASTAEGARHAANSPGGFKAAFGTIVSQCRSCHSVYK